MIAKKSKRLIKVIRRTDSEALSAAAVQVANRILSDRADNEKESRQKPSTLDSTVLRWISERRENSRSELNAALEILDGKALLAGR